MWLWAIGALPRLSDDAAQEARNESDNSREDSHSPEAWDGALMGG